ncbi:MAG: ABC transporter permease [Parachlamydiaceae bacterium]|nr:ABC transporter permease [Parachlamydiaceae bacterium]
MTNLSGSINANDTVIRAYLPTTQRKRLIEKFMHHRLGMCGLTLLSFILLMTIAGPFVSGYRYDEIHLALKNESPSWTFWFGTDDLGRDVFTRVCYGARISLFVGITAAIIDLCIGILWGGTSGLAGGHVDEIMMRIADILYSLPYLLVVILLIVLLGSGLTSIIIGITIIGWISMARMVRGQILLLKEMDYIQAARTLGASFWRILFKHLLPNASGPILVSLMLTIPSAIFAEAFLSFLGLGIQAPIASWGTMASESLPALQYYPWRLFFPAFFISMTMLSFHMIGEGLKAAFNKSEQVNQL